MKGAPPPLRKAVAAPLSDRDIDTLQGLLDAVPAPLEPLDVSSLDGFLCALLVQPERVPHERWLACITDDEGRALPLGYDPTPLHALALRRHAELDAAIARRQWFDPWVFDLEGSVDAPGEAVLPWVAGVATAFELFPGLMRLPAEETVEPLALLYRHLDAQDLEDADELLAEIESLEPIVDLEDAVEGLVRAILLLADLTRPLR
ncbi:MAG: YecA family protein [Pseudomonadota bacterium]|nr:YecA family protein [Pseudomonadota bacterium]